MAGCGRAVYEREKNRKQMRMERGGTKATVLYLLLILGLMLPACSAERTKRAAYDSLQNRSEMDCRSRPGADCPEKQSYDEYRRDLKNNGGR